MTTNPKQAAKERLDEICRRILAETNAEIAFRHAEALFDIRRAYEQEKECASILQKLKQLEPEPSPYVKRFMDELKVDEFVQREDRTETEVDTDRIAVLLSLGHRMRVEMCAESHPYGTSRIALNTWLDGVQVVQGDCQPDPRRMVNDEDWNVVCGRVVEALEEKENGFKRADGYDRSKAPSRDETLTLARYVTRVIQYLSEARILW